MKSKNKIDSFDFGANVSQNNCANVSANTALLTVRLEMVVQADWHRALVADFPRVRVSR